MKRTIIELAVALIASIIVSVCHDMIVAEKDKEIKQLEDVVAVLWNDGR